MGEGIHHRSAQTVELALRDRATDTDGGHDRHAFVESVVVDRDRQAQRLGHIAVDALQNAIEKLTVSGVFAGLKGRGWHGASHSLVTTAATRSSPEIPRSVVMGPAADTIMVSSVLAAMAKRARTAALSQ